MNNTATDQFAYRNKQLYAEDMAITDLVEQFGTPCYIYSRAHFEAQYLAYANALADKPHLICYAVKANSNIAVLNVLARLGAGFDIVSRGELERVIAAGGDPGKTVFSGVAKSADEIRFALATGIHCFNVESEAELHLINQIATEMDTVAPVSLRVNPDVDANTHPYISTGLKDNKFGIAIDQALRIYRDAENLSHINTIGIDCHIGSQLTELAPFLDALDCVLKLIDELAEQGIQLQHLDIGGGLGVRYQDETPPSAGDYIEAVLAKLSGRALTLVLEPGRSIAANAGMLITRVEYLKRNEAKNFALIDAGMNDMIRPSLYQAWLDILPVSEQSDATAASYDVVGPVCETGDFLGKSRELKIAAGDLLAVASSGAYGFTMSSNYNSRPRAAEIMVDGDKAYLIRERETFADLIRGESLLP